MLFRDLLFLRARIALAKQYLINKTTNELLKVENIPITPHLTEECNRVIAEKTIKTFNLFFDKIDHKKKVISFVEKHRDNPRKTLKKKQKNP